MKLIFVMRNGAFKPQGSPCLKSSISGPPGGETFQTTHPVKKPIKKSKKDSPKFAFTNLFPGAIVLCNFCFSYHPTQKEVMHRQLLPKFLLILLLTSLASCGGGGDEDVGRQPGPVEPPAGTFTAVSAGGKHTCGILDTGAVVVLETGQPRSSRCRLRAPSLW